MSNKSYVRSEGSHYLKHGNKFKRSVFAIIVLILNPSLSAGDGLFNYVQTFIRPWQINLKNYKIFNKFAMH